jgi:hypothetical protein
VSKELLGLEHRGVRKAQGAEDIKGNQVHGVSGTPDKLRAFYTESGFGQAALQKNNRSWIAVPACHRC